MTSHTLLDVETVSQNKRTFNFTFTQSINEMNIVMCLWALTGGLVCLWELGQWVLKVGELGLHNPKPFRESDLLSFKKLLHLTQYPHPLGVYPYNPEAKKAHELRNHPSTWLQFDGKQLSLNYRFARTQAHMEEILDIKNDRKEHSH